MDNIIFNITLIVIGTLAGVIGSIFLFSGKMLISLENKKEESLTILEKSKEEFFKIKEESNKKNEWFKERMKIDEEKRSQRIKKTEELLKYKEENNERKERKLDEIRLKIATYKEEYQSLSDSIRRMEEASLEKLTAKTNCRIEDLKKEILIRHETELKEENTRKLAEIEENLKENAVKKANSILVGTMQRLCSPTSVETRAVIIKVPKDHIKGKIVGRYGSNLEILENLLDVAVVFNDLPNSISLSAFNLVTRRIAEVTIEKLTKVKGDINKLVIERMVKEAERETDKELFAIGEEALKQMGIKSGNKDFIRTVGRLKYRTSYGQNIMKHSMEVGWISAMIGSEIGLDVKICKNAGFLHDLGKAIDQEAEVKDGHDRLTKELMEKFGFSGEEIHAAWAHHDAIRQETPEALIVKASDAVSGGRPGARQDSLERYMEKMQAIDSTVYSFQGVKKSFAMSAGREVRIYVDPEIITDEKMKGMAKDVAKKIEENVTYPGKIKIKLIRRIKNMETAK